jgi:hypothetical protein
MREAGRFPKWRTEAARHAASEALESQSNNHEYIA